jgi:hypothetical protein
MKKEKVIVARNSESENSASQYLGAEVSIGKLSLEKQAELKEHLQSGNFFTEMAGMWGETYMGSEFLTDLMDVNDIYHKNGIIFYEDTGELNDVESLSTDNWEVNDLEDENWEPRRDSEGNTYAKKIKIPEEGVIVLNIRLQDLYFIAEGEFPIDYKSDAENFLVDLYQDTIGKGFIPGFDFILMHTASINSEPMTRDEDAEAKAGNIYYNTHFVFKDGEFIGWLSSNNDAFGFPFDIIDSSPSCINPVSLHTAEYDWAVKSLLDKL